MSDYEEEREYVKELFWESKGLGRSNPPKSEEITLTGKEIPCPKCNRVRDEAIIQRHLPKCGG